MHFLNSTAQENAELLRGRRRYAAMITEVLAMNFLIGHPRLMAVISLAGIIALTIWLSGWPPH